MGMYTFALFLCQILLYGLFCVPLYFDPRESDPDLISCSAAPLRTIDN